MRTLLSLAGRSGAGKTTLAKQLEAKYGYVRYSFATPLKKLCVDLLGLDPDCVYGTQAQKAQLTKIKRSDILTWASLVSSSVHPDSFLTYAEVMQEVATWVRQCNENAFVNYCIKEINADEKSRFVIDDHRYPNESKRVHEAGGYVIFLNRGVPLNDHESESYTAEQLNADLILSGDSSVLEWLYQIFCFLATK